MWTPFIVSLVSLTVPSVSSLKQTVSAWGWGVGSYGECKATSEAGQTFQGFIPCHLQCAAYETRR